MEAKLKALEGVVKKPATLPQATLSFLKTWSTLTLCSKGNSSSAQQPTLFDVDQCMSPPVNGFRKGAAKGRTHCMTCDKSMPSSYPRHSTFLTAWGYRSSSIPIRTPQGP